MANGDGDIVQTVKIEVDDEQLKKLGDTAEKSFDDLGKATDKASDALEKLANKAEDANKDLEKLGDKSGEGLEKLGDKAGEAEKDLGKLGDTAGDADKDLEKLGEKADDAGKDLEKLADTGKHSLEEIQHGAEYAGTSLEDFQRMSERTQDQYVEYAKRVVDSSKDIVEAVKGTADAMGEVGKQGSGAEQGLGGVGKGLNDVSEKSGISSREMRAFGKILGAFGLGEIAGVLTGLARVAFVLGPVGGIALAAGLAAKALYGFGKAAEENAEAAEKLSKTLSTAPEKIEQMARAFEQAGGKLKDFVKYVNELNLEMAKLNKLEGLSEEMQKSLTDGANNVGKLKDQFKDMMTHAQEWPRSLNDLGKAVKSTIDPLTDAGTAAKALQEALVRIPGVMKDGKLDIDEYHKRLNRLYNQMDDFGKLKLEEIFKKMKIPDEVISQITKTTEEYDKLQKKLADQQWQQDVFKEFYKSIGKAKDALADFGKDAAAGFLRGIYKLSTEGGTMFVEGFLKPIGEAFSKIPEIIGRMFSDLGDLIASGAKALGQSFMEGFVNPIIEGFKSLWEMVKDFFKGIVEIAQAAWDAVVKFFNDNLIKPITEAFDKFKQFCKETFDSISKTITDAFDAVTEPVRKVLKGITDWIDGIVKKAKELWNALTGASSAAQGGLAYSGGGEAGLPMASGGLISGPGTPTSDNILSWLSPGEFVVRAAAVSHWGVDMMRALNSAPRFATGGLSQSIPRLATPASTFAMAGQRSLTLNIEGRSFAGMTIPENTAQALERFAVHSQIASAGRKQSWRR